MARYITYLIFSALGIALLVSSILFFNVSFLQDFTSISPDRNIASSEAREMISLARMTFIIIALIIISFPYYYRYLPHPRIISLHKRNRHSIYFAIALLLILAIYFSSMFISDYQFTRLNERPAGRFSALLYAYKTAAHFVNTFSSLISTEEVDVNKIDLPIYKLLIKEEDIERLNSDLPASGEEYVDGYMIYGNTTYLIKARYRGDSKLHWYFEKKSWRINIKDEQTIISSSKFNLINPKYKSHMQTLLGYYVSDRLGLITPRSYHVAVFLNNEYIGVYYYNDQIDEMFINMLGKTHGDIYFGDTNQSLFETAERWDIMSTYDGNKGRARQNIRYLISAINADDTEFYKFFNQHLGEDYIRFYAYNALIGDAHVSEVANHKLYLDPEKKIFEPVVWDQITFSDANSALDPDHNSLFNKTSRIPEYMHTKNLYLKRFMEELPENLIIDYIDNTTKNIEYEITHDKYKDSRFPPWTLSNSEWRESVQELKESVRARYAFIRKKLNTTFINMSIAGNKVLFDVDGVSTAETAPIFTFDGNDCPRAYKDLNFDLAAEDEEMIPAKCNSNKIYLNTQVLYPGKNGPLRYVYIIENPHQILDVSIQAHNSITEAKVYPTINFVNSTLELPQIPKTESIHPWILQNLSETQKNKG